MADSGWQLSAIPSSPKCHLLEKYFPSPLDTLHRTWYNENKKEVKMLEVLNYSEARRSLKSVLESAADRENTVVITCENRSSAVLISLNRLNELERAEKNEAYLKMLRQSEQEAQAGKTVSVTLDDLETGTTGGE